MPKTNVKVPTTMRDTLYNMHKTSGATDDYRKGIIVGMVGGLMAASGVTFTSAVDIVALHMPDAGARMVVPESWLVPFGTAMTKYGKTYILPV